MNDKSYCYPNSNVLKNKFDITDGELLKENERYFSSIRAIELELNPVHGAFDLLHLQEIHKRLFQDVYSWAGDIRTVDIAKGNLFCLSQFIEGAAEDIFRNLKKDDFLKDLKIDEFVPKLASYMADVNSLHPFREGNGRTQRIFFTQLAKEAGYDLNINEWKKEFQLQADIEAMGGKMEKLETLLFSTVKAIGQEIGRNIQDTSLGGMNSIQEYCQAVYGNPSKEQYIESDLDR